jgi:hypothetical protein
MIADVVAVRVADENAVGARLRLMRIEPELERGKINSTAIELKSQRRHGDNLSAEGRESSVEGEREVIPTDQRCGNKPSTHFIIKWVVCHLDEFSLDGAAIMKSGRLLRTLVFVAAGIAIAIFFAAISTIFGRSSSFSGALAKEVGKGEGTIIRIQQLTPFPWERFYVYGPYTPVSKIEETLGFSWPGAKKTDIEMSEGFNLLVFVNDKKIMKYVMQPRNKGDFTQDSQSNPFAPEDAVFTVTRRDEGFPLLEPPFGRHDASERTPDGVDALHSSILDFQR